MVPEAQDSLSIINSFMVVCSLWDKKLLVLLSVGVHSSTKVSHNIQCAVIFHCLYLLWQLIKEFVFYLFLFCLSEYHCTSHTIECMFQFRHHFGSVVFILCLSSYWFQRYGELWIYRFARNIILSILNKKIERLSLITMVFYHSFDDHHEKWYWSTLI